MLCVRLTELEKDLCRRLIRGVAMSVRVRLSISGTVGFLVQLRSCSMTYSRAAHQSPESGP